MRFSLGLLSLATGVLCAPPLLSLRAEDWKTALGWDGKTTTPAQLDSSNVVRPTPGKPAAAAISGGVYFCTEANFKGQCLFVSGFTDNQCVNFGNEFNDKVTSFGPDKGIACLLYSDWNCAGTNPGGWMVNPGSSDLSQYKFNDIAKRAFSLTSPIILVMGAFSSRTTAMAQPDLSGRVLMVTGANRGIGFETAKQLYKLGGTVYLGVRSEDNARQAIERIRADVTRSDGQLKWLPLDLSTVGQARESAEAFLKLEDRLDILINNACLGDAAYELNEDGIEKMMAINHVGHYVLTTTLLGLMKKTSSEKGSDVRIVNVCPKSFHLHYLPTLYLSKPFPPKNPNTWSHTIARYSRTKLANLLFTQELQRQLDEESCDIITVSVHPGYVATVRESMAKMPILGWMSNILAKFFLIDEAAGARNSVYAASNPVIRSDPERHRGKFMTPIGTITPPSVLAQDPDLARDLWTLTEKLVYQRMNP
ncbi:short chain dehydrogenase [Rhizoctonia solani 123E]|uniref:Short chain dehydrogenase n=1 Tax=Rhizoctonia solani 123E TaxID=1423351 RepID=A0A074RX53_9AGAM|nr:short chain dehydrogenase [Rhizoctonia solani 123E]